MVRLARDDFVLGGDDPGVARRAFGDFVVAVDLPCLVRAGFARLLLAERVRQERHRLDVGPCPTDIGHRDDANAAFDDLGVERPLRPRGHDQAWPRAGRKRKLAWRRAAGDLEIDDAVDDAVAPHGFAHHRFQRRVRHRRRDAQLGERAVQARKMQCLVDETAAAHRDDLVNAVGELEAAILDMDASMTVRNIAAVDVGDTRHSGGPERCVQASRFCSRSPLVSLPLLAPLPLPPTPSDLSLRCSADRSMPTNAAVREMLPPKRVTWAMRYSRSNISRASRNGRPMSSPPLSHLTTAGATVVISGGRLSARIGSRASPGVMISTQSMTLRSWRTLPGHS